MLALGFFSLSVSAQQNLPDWSAVQRQWDAQLRLAGRQGGDFHKSIYVHQEKGFHHRDTVLSSGGISAGLYALLQTELEPCFSASFLNPEIADWFDISAQGDTLIGIRKEASESKTRLQEQKIVRDTQTGVIRFVQSRIYRSNWLYTEKIDVQVHFDARGKYCYHVLSLSTDVPMSGTFVVMVSGGTFTKP